MGELNIGITSTVIGGLLVTIILAFNSFIWVKRSWIKSKAIGWYQKHFGNVKETKYTIGAAEYIKEFKQWTDKSQEGISIVLPYFHVEMTYDNIIGIRVFRSTKTSGHVMEVTFREGRNPKCEHLFGISDEAIAKVARRIYFQEVVGK